LTAYASEQDRANALAAGFAVHVPKPVHPLDLAKVIERLTVNGRSPRRVAAGG